MIKIKTVAYVIEVLIGVFLCSTNELSALAFMEWMGIEVDLFMCLT